MKRYFWCLIFCMLLTVTSLAAAIIFLIGKEVFIYNQKLGNGGWLLPKHAQMQKTANSDKRIVFLSGSNSTFGINAFVMTESLKRPVVNLASTAVLGRYIFYDAKHWLKPGDTLFLPLEYGYYSDHEQIAPLNNSIVQMVIECDGDYFWNTSFKEKKQIATYVFSHIGDLRFPWKYYWRKSLGREDKTTILNVCSNNPYDLDKYGNTVSADTTKNNFENKFGSVDRRYLCVGNFHNCKLWPLTLFIKWCNDNHIKVFGLAPCYYHGPKMTKDEIVLQEQIKKYYQMCGAEFIGNLSDGFYRKEYMYDTDYHLNRRGRELRTKYLIDKLKEILDK